MQSRGPPHGYFSEPTKSILVVAPQNVERAEDFFRGMEVKVVAGSGCLGGYVGDREAEDSWLAEKVQGWIEKVKTLSGVALKHPQSAYSGLQKSLQHELAFMQRVLLGRTGDVGHLHSSRLPGPGRGNTGERSNLPTCEIGGPDTP